MISSYVRGGQWLFGPYIQSWRIYAILLGLFGTCVMWMERGGLQEPVLSPLFRLCRLLRRDLILADI